MELSSDEDDLLQDEVSSDASLLTQEPGTLALSECVVVDSVTGNKCVVLTTQNGRINDPVVGAQKKSAKGSFSCKQCSQEFAWKNSLRRHVLTIHKNHRPYVCSECDYSATERIVLKRHVIKAHSSNNDGLLYCDLCSYSSLEKSKLKRHLNSVHQRIKPFKCRKCTFSADDRSRVKRHFSSVHNGSKPFCCPYCDHSTSEKCNLKIHIMSVHLQIKSFACEFCDYSASEKGTLQKHVKMVHKSKGIGVDNGKKRVLDAEVGTSNSG